MRPVVYRTAIVATSLWAMAAMGEDADPRFCPTRPSLGQSSCTTLPGQVHLEYSFADWQRDNQPDQHENRFVTADLLARAGVGANTEVQLGWTAFGHDRTRDMSTREVDTVNDTGDVMLAVRQHLTGRQGVPFSAAVEAFVSLPSGHAPVGDGTWAAGVTVPVQYNLTPRAAIALTGEGDAAANESGRGQHLSYDGIGTFRYKLTDDVNAYAELEVQRDNDPSRHTTKALAAVSGAWRPIKTLQFDLLAVAGLNHAAPDIRLVLGGAVLF